MTSESSVLDTLKIFVQVYNSGSENFLFRRKKIVRCFVHFMDFSRESGEACAERRSSIHYAFIMRAGKGVLEHLKKRGRGGCEMFGNVEKQRRNKEKSTNLSVGAFGGDEGDRTPYLLNAIQALSQVSYTPTGLPLLRLLEYYSSRGGVCQGFGRKKFAFFAAAGLAPGWALCYNTHRLMPCKEAAHGQSRKNAQRDAL